MWIIGSILLIIGVWIDAKHGWDQLPFLTNMVSALDGALFGLPVALVVVTRLAVREANRSEYEEIFRRLGNVSRRMFEQARDVEMILPPTERQEVDVAISRLANAVGELRPRLDRMVSNSDKRDYFRVSHEIDTGIVDLIYVWRPIEKSMSRETEDIAAEWRVCGDYLRPRLAALGIPWIRPELDSAIHAHMEELMGMLQVGAYHLDVDVLPRNELPPNARPPARPFVAAARIAMGQPSRLGKSTLEAIQQRLMNLQRLLVVAELAVIAITTACHDMDEIIELHRDKPRRST